MKRPPPPSTDRTIGASAGRRSGGRGRALLALTLLLPLAACATKSDVRDLQEEVRELAARQEALVRELQQDQRTQGESIGTLSGELGEHRAQNARTLRDIEDQLIRLQELFGVSQREIAALRDQMERRPVPRPGGPGATESGGEAEDLYDAALTQYRRDALTSARMGFEQIVDEFPQHELAPSARYYLADILLQDGDEEAAIAEFLRIAEFHPDADRVPEALLRVGLIHRDRGETEDARRYLERVVNTWPDTLVAEEAEQVLRELG